MPVPVPVPVPVYGGLPCTLAYVLARPGSGMTADLDGPPERRSADLLWEVGPVVALLAETDDMRVLRALVPRWDSLDLEIAYPCRMDCSSLKVSGSNRDYNLKVLASKARASGSRPVLAAGPLAFAPENRCALGMAAPCTDGRTYSSALSTLPA